MLDLNEEDWDVESKVRYNNLKNFLLGFTLRANEDKRILIIAHGVTNRLILATMLEMELKNLVRFRLSETGISKIYWAQEFGNWRLKYWNDVAHNKEENFI